MRRLALAALTVGIIGLIFAATKGSGDQRAAVASSPDAPAIGAPASSGASSPDKMRRPARRRFGCLPQGAEVAAGQGRPVPETDFESYPARQPGSSTRDTVVQRTAKHEMPSRSQNFDGISNLCGCYPPDTERRRGPEPLHGVGQRPLRDLHARRGPRSSRRRPGTRSSRARRSAAPTTTATRSSSTTSSPAAGWSRSSPSTARAGAVLPVHRGLESERPDRRLVRATSSSSTRRSSTTTRSSGSGRRRTRTR